MTTLTLEIPLLLPNAGDCAACTDRLRTELGALKGVTAAELDASAGRLTLTYDPMVLSLPVLEERVREAGATLARRFRHTTLELEGLHCPDCAVAIEHGLQHAPGVLSATASFAAARLHVEYDADGTDPEGIAVAVSRTGYRVRLPGEASDVTILRVPEMDCQDEVKAIEGTLRSMAGARTWQVNLLERTVRVQFDPSLLTREAILAAVRRLGMTPVEMAQAVPQVGWWKDTLLLSTAASGVLLLGALAADWLLASALPSIILATLALLSGGWPAARKALRAARARRLDMNVLMTVAVLGAVGIGEWREAATVAFLFALAQVLETFSLDRARQAVRRLLDIAPAQATVRRGGGEERLPVATVNPGEVILVRPGERIALDGTVRAGISEVNQAPITGESRAMEKIPGTQVFAGSINGAGALEVEVSHRAQETMLARIIALVEEAQTQKAPAQAFVERFAAIYTPAVIVGAVLIAILPPLLLAQEAWPWIYRALVLLVIACPCALVISTPVAVVCGLSRAARAGILIKGGRYLEAVGQLRVMAFDKTGTLTRGTPEVIAVRSLNGTDPREVLRLAAAIEARSEHPLARAVLRTTRGQGIAWPEVTGFRAVPGRGATAQIAGRPYYLGNHQYAVELGIAPGDVEAELVALEAAGQSPVILSDGVQALGILGLADQVRQDARECLADLHRLGVSPLVMLTGDVPGTAEVIAREVGIDQVRAGLLPDQKVAAIKALVQEHGRVGMVGDGINDAPALAAATVGIAMGAAGTDAAIETADLTLMGDDLRQIPVAIRLGRRTLRVVQVNILLSLLTKGAFVLLAVLGQATLWMAVAADMGTSLAVILNGMRLLGNGRPTPSSREGSPLTPGDGEGKGPTIRAAPPAPAGRT